MDNMINIHHLDIHKDKCILEIKQIVQSKLKQFITKKKEEIDKTAINETENNQLQSILAYQIK